MHREELLPPREVAVILGCCENTLSRWRAQATGPSYIKIGGRIRYPRSLLDQYVEAQTTHTEREVA